MKIDNALNLNFEIFGEYQSINFENFGNNGQINFEETEKSIIFTHIFVMDADRIFKRKIYDRLLKWKETSNGKSALLVQGARRIGKSTIVEEFEHRK